MFHSRERRRFLKVAGAGLLASVGDFGFLGRLPGLSAQEVPRRIAPVAADLEPLVRLIEETQRERIVETVVEQIRGGSSYRDVLGAVMLAGVRGIQPRPVGFKFHAVLVVNSAHLASLAARDQDRWLPLIWAIDNFKASQARNRQEGDWRMGQVEEGQLPSVAEAGTRFREAMERWDETGADRAVAQLARTASAGEVYEMFWRLGARDFRDIGHKAIFVANSFRALQTIGWRHAEPILRSLAYALLAHEGDNPAQRDDVRDRSWRDNLERARTIRTGWQQGRVSRETGGEFLTVLRTRSADEASHRAVAMLNAEVDPNCLWDGIFLAAGELLMRLPGIPTLHSVTCMNALRFAYEQTSSDDTRKMLLLQAAAFMPLFRDNAGNRLSDLRIDAIAAEAPTAQGAAAFEEIFADATRDKLLAARKTLAIMQGNQQLAEPFMAHARRLIFAKGSDAHDYKFSAASWEDYHHTTSPWRDRFLAAGLFYLRGSGSADTALYGRARAALG